MIAISLFMALLLYSLFAWFTIRMVGRAARFCAFTVTTKRVLQTLCALVLVLGPTWDIIPSRIYFTYLCTNRAEVKIFKTIHLEGKYFLPNGLADGQKVGDQFKSIFSSDKQFSVLFNIEKHESSLQESGTGEVLGTAKEFIYHGNWITRLILPEAMYSCSKYQPFGAHMALWREVIRHQGQG